MTFINIPDAISPSVTWKDPVGTFGDLPGVGNNPGDTRITLDTSFIYVWDGFSWVPRGTTGSGTVVGPSHSVFGEIAIYADTSGQNITRSTGTGIAHLTSGVLSVSPVNLASSDVTGILPIANGGTGSATQNFVDLTTNQTVAGNKTFTGQTAVTNTTTTAFTVNTTSLVVDATNNVVGINKVPNANTPLDINGDNTSSGKNIRISGFGSGGPSTFIGRRAQGTIASPSAVTNGNTITAFSGVGYGTSQFAGATTGNFNIIAGETFTNTSNATYLTFETTPTGSILKAERMRIGAAGRILINTTTDDGSNQLQVNGNIIASNFTGSSTGTNTGDVTLAAVGSSPNANAASLSGQVLTLQPANGTNPGVLTSGTQTIGGNKTFTGSISASNLSGTNTGDVTLGAFGSSPNSSGASLSGQVLTLQPADGSNGGGVSTTTQTFAGNKTFTGNVAITSTSTTALTVNTISLVVDATNNAVGIGTTPAATAVLDIVNNSGTTKAIQVTGYGSNVGFRGRQAQGTLGSPTQTLNGNTITFFSGRGYGTTGFAAASTGVVNINATENFTDTSMATAISFSTTQSGSVSSTERMRINSTGNVLIGTNVDNVNNKLQVNGSFLAGTATLIDAANIATNASLANRFTVTLGGNRNLSAPTNPTDGQKVIWIFTQDGTGSRTLTYDAIFDFGNMPTLILSTAAGKRDYMGAIYNSAATKWDVVAYSSTF